MTAKNNKFNRRSSNIRESFEHKKIYLKTQKSISKQKKQLKRNRDYALRRKYYTKITIEITGYLEG